MGRKKIDNSEKEIRSDKIKIFNDKRRTQGKRKVQNIREPSNEANQKEAPNKSEQEAQPSRLSKTCIAGVKVEPEDYYEFEILPENTSGMSKVVVKVEPKEYNEVPAQSDTSNLAIKVNVKFEPEDYNEFEIEPDNSSSTIEEEPLDNFLEVSLIEEENSIVDPVFSHNPVMECALIGIEAIGAVQNLLESSDDDSSDDDEDVIHCFENRPGKGIIPRTQNYVETTVHRMNDETFKSQFRMRRDTLEFLINLLGKDLQKQSIHFGRHPISIEKQLLLTIWTMATPDSYRSLSDRFNVGKATACRTVWKVVRSIYKHLPVYIKWPTREEARITSNHVYRKYGFPGVLGAVDGTHIRITQPKEHHVSYINQKGFHSIQTQLVCDHKLKFIHTYCGEAGSVDDASVFRLSNLQNYCTPEFFADDTHLLGDTAYSIQPCIMVPYRNIGNINQESLRYNIVHSSARMMIEQANASLKGRFRSLLDKLPFKKTELIPYYFNACCILHNICILRNDEIDIPILVNHEIPPFDIDIEMNNAMKIAGTEKRERLKNLINNI